MKSYKKANIPPALSLRVGGRLKKAKIPFDPSDFTVTKRQTEQYFPTKKITTSSQQNVCCHCQKTDNLVHCKGECETRIHLTCLQATCERFGKDEELTWKCSSCQTCKMCKKNVIDDDKMLKCYICFSYYHVKCHGHEEIIPIVKENRFGCRFCVDDANNYIPRKTRAFTQKRPKPVSSEIKFSDDELLGFCANELEQKHIERHREGQQPSTSTEKRSLGSSENLSIDDDTDIPEATEWSVEQVFKYFHGKFPKYAHVLKHHQIDGPSLYLLKRSDVVKEFNIKIGPALKMYAHILKLQTKCSDPTLSWQ